MALPKLFQRIFWHNNTTPAINEDNLNAMSKAIDDIDNRVIVLGDDVITVIPQIQAYLNQAEDLVEAMELLSENPPYIGQNGNWWVWDTNTSAFVDSGVDASISVDIADITMLAPNAEPYVTNTGTATDPIFHLFIPRGQTGKGISTIAKTGTSGLVDTYTITMTDGTTSTFTVTNGAGDMNKSVYDPTNAIANAGGMKSAAAKDSTNAVTANSTDLVESGAVYTANKSIYEVMGENGAKNKAKILSLADFATMSGATISGNTATFRGVAFTFNADKTVTVNGTASPAIAIPISENLTGVAGIILSGCPSGGSAIGYQLQLHDGTSGDYPIGDYGEGRQLTLDPSHIYDLMIVIRSGITVNNLTYKPMVRDAKDTDPTYQPYAMTNRELTEELAITDYWSEAKIAAKHYFSGSFMKKYGAIVTLSFAVSDELPASTDTKVLELPAGCRPAGNFIVPAYVNGVANGHAWIRANGDVEIRPSTAGTYLGFTTTFIATQ